MKKDLDYFRYILWPRFLWEIGGKYIDYAISYWHIRVRKLPPYWNDADPTYCELAICRYCGRGGKD